MKKPYSIEELEQELEVIQFLLSYIKHPKGFILITGSNGTGKTETAKAVYQTQTAYFLPHYDKEAAIFITQALLNIKYEEFRNKHGDVYMLHEEICQTKFLVLDDLGTRKPSEAFMDFLYGIFDFRFEYRHQLGTLITTNLDLKGLREKFGEAIVSRITSGKGFRFDGRDRRRDKENL